MQQDGACLYAVSNETSGNRAKHGVAHVVQLKHVGLVSALRYKRLLR